MSIKPTSNGDIQLDTRRRLINAAGEVFAERGYRAATIREIVERAGANVAAVNYHFGDKENLYLEVLTHVCHGSDVTVDLDPQATPERWLHDYVHAFLRRILGQDRKTWHHHLMAHEIAEPSVALQALVDRVMKPMTTQLVGIVRAVAGPSLTEQQAWMCAQSIVAQCVHQKHAEEVIRRFDAPLPHGPAAVDVLADHITQFSLAAIRGYEAPRLLSPAVRACQEPGVPS